MTGHGIFELAGHGARARDVRGAVQKVLWYGMLYCVPLTVGAVLLTGVNEVTVGLMAVSVVLWGVDRWVGRA